MERLHTAGFPPDKDSPIGAVVDHRRSQPVPIGISEEGRETALINSDERVGGAKVDTRDHDR